MNFRDAIRTAWLELGKTDAEISEAFSQSDKDNPQADTTTEIKAGRERRVIDLWKEILQRKIPPTAGYALEDDFIWLDRN